MSSLTGNQKGTQFDDIFKGFVDIAGSTDLFGVGINNASVFSFAGKDTIEGSATISSTSNDVEAVGVSLSLVGAGADDDTLTFTARAHIFKPIAGRSTALAYGVKRSILLGGSGDDRFSIKSGTSVSLFSGLPDSNNGVLAKNYGLYQTFLNGGDGDDRIFIDAYYQTPYELQAGLSNDTIGVYQSSIRGGRGNDVINIQADVGGNYSKGYGAYQASISGGEGDDGLVITALGDNPTGAYQTTIDGGAGNDRVSITGGVYSVFAEDDGLGTGAYQTTVNGGAGNDYMKIIGTVFIGPNSNGIGVDESSVFGGDGNDTIEIYGFNAIGTASFGVRKGIVNGGDGNDLIAISGTTLGIQDALINGGKGDDFLAIGTGQGTIDGGEGLDRIYFEFLSPQSFKSSGITLTALPENGLQITGTRDGNRNPATWTQTILNMELFRVSSSEFTSAQEVVDFLQAPVV